MKRNHPDDLTREPLLYRLRAFVCKPANLLLVFFLCVLVVLSLFPMVTMLSNMFTIHLGTEKKITRLPTGTLTLIHFGNLFKGNEWRECVKAASFFSDGVEYAAILDSNDTCVIPKEALTRRRFSVSITGIRKGFKIKTNRTDVKQEVM